MEQLIPDLSVDPPWTSVIRSDINHSEKSTQVGLMLHWKEAYLPEYCDQCVHGLQPIYTVEWRKGRIGPWRVLDDDLVDTTSYKLPSYVVKSVLESANLPSQAPEVRVVCRNEYGSSLPTKSLKLTNFGLPKQVDVEGDQYQQKTSKSRSDEALFSLPTLAIPDGE
uniref:Fibronectin type-III domain-containing protein n=1 Tax=Mesocestoides corti TaxID=53468 RepID=A0A5K3G302_MESCO